MKRLCLFFFPLLISVIANAQNDGGGLPHTLTRVEIDHAIEQGITLETDRGITTPPPYTNIRAMAEWEEIQALVVSWMSYPVINKKIVAAAKLECEVIILTESISTTTTYLLANNAGGPPLTLDNITMIQVNLDSVWERDYGANTVYGDEVDDLYLVDWIYNRPRPADDVTPDAIGSNLGIPVYSNTVAPNNLMNTGGNFMSDGFGNAFASELVLMENMGGSAGWTNYPNHTEAEIDAIMQNYMGIDNYIKMPVLPYDGIHHIDMHMKLIDEETIILSKYPDGVADGPQIEANINYVLNNFTTKWGTPYKIIEVPAPPQQSTGTYPNAGGWYLTYANAVFVNKTVILPTYYTQYDTTAIRIWQEALPGYTIVPIDCDASGSNIISAGGAIHCITNAVGVEDPLLISYKLLENTNNTSSPYPLQAYINHRTGVSSATLYYKTNLANPYTAVPMTYTGSNLWNANIPPQSFNTTVYYYVEATSVSGKVQRRPIVAPVGYNQFKVINEVFGCTDATACNYDSAATIDNGTCVLPDGCTDSGACNYDPAANCDDGSCQSGATYTLSILTDCWGEETSWNITNSGGTILYSQAGGTLGDQTTYTWDVCLNSGCYNFNIYDAYGDGIGGSQWASCDVDGDYSMVDGNGNILVDMIVADFGASETHNFCVSSDVSGCTNPTACNYDNTATIDNGSCTYPGCTDVNACNYNSSAGCSNGSCEYLTCAGCTNASACNYDNTATIDNGSCTFPGCTDVNACNYNSSAGCSNGSCEYISCAGCTNSSACNYDNTSTIDNGSCTYPGCTDVNACNYNSSAGCSNGSCEYLTCAGCTNASACNYDNTATIDDGSCTFPGCTDVNACNYNSSAGCSNGSCEYISCAGCTNLTACNYDNTATIDDGSCTFPGCTDENACNYDSSAGCDDGSCIAPGCMDGAACNYDQAATCDGGVLCEYNKCNDPSACSYVEFAPCIDNSVCTYPGCTDTNACNYNSSAGCDDASCEYLSCTCPGDLTGDGVVNTSDLLVFLGAMSCTGTCIADFTGDGLVNTSDLLLFLGFYGTICP